MSYGTRYIDCREVTRKPKLIKTALEVLSPTQHVTYFFCSFTLNIFSDGKRKFDNIMPDLLKIIVQAGTCSFFTLAEVVINILFGT
jgi:hypothetical protein